MKLTNQLISYFDDARLEQVPQEENSEADEVAKLAWSNETIENPRLYMEVQTVPCIEGLHVFQVQPTNTCVDPILSYIKDGQLPSNPFKAWKIKVRSFKFTIMNDELY